MILGLLATRLFAAAAANSHLNVPGAHLGDLPDFYWVPIEFLSGSYSDVYQHVSCLDVPICERTFRVMSR